MLTNACMIMTPQRETGESHILLQGTFLASRLAARNIAQLGSEGASTLNGQLQP